MIQAKRLYHLLLLLCTASTLLAQEEVTYPLAAGIYLVVHSGCNIPHKLLIP